MGSLRYHQNCISIVGGNNVLEYKGVIKSATSFSVLWWPEQIGHFSLVRRHGILSKAQSKYGQRTSVS